MKLSFLSGKHVLRLREQAESNANKYGTSSSWLDAFLGGKPYIHESAFIVDPPPALIISEEDNSANDAENAKKIYTWLGKLSLP